ncbi:methionine ABC transporter ATP-binding protein [Arthrobacter sp. LS16]|uniref:methionine ABC transporter ATP-binding protein n=1 Tax=Arthrobacter sp. 'calajunan' TaxID=1690248 RepID=UPI0006B254A7|nr:ABC transporter [Arthrobacter sp. LS16]
MIHLQDVTTTFGEGENKFTAVKNVNLDIAQGSIHGIIGFSGAGKSTLLRNINLLQRPTSGKVLVEGIDLMSLNEEELRAQRHQIGMIFQHFNLLNNRTAVQNVELNLKFQGVPKRERRQRALEALSVVDLSDKASAYPGQLSGGQKQRISIARALVTEPKILLCDEPTSAVDPRTTASVLQYLSDINANLGITTIIVTHEMNVIKAIADKVSVMEDGSVVEEFELRSLKEPGFEPQTSIGRYLISDEISLQRRNKTNELATSVFA